MLRNAKAFAIVALGSVMVLGCSSAASSGGGSSGSGSSGSGSKAPYTVGYAGPLSGDLAFVGNPYRTGALAYIDYVNAHGGVNGHQIVFKSGDDTDSPSVAAGLITQYVQSDNAIAVMEGGSTTVTGSLSPVLNQLQVPLVTFSCLPTQVFDPMSTKYCFDPEVSASSEAVAQAEFALKLVPNAKVMLVPTNNPYGLQWLPAATNYIKQHGGSVVSTSYVPLTGVDMSAAVNAVTSSKPQVVISVLNDNQMVTFGHGLAQQNMQSTPVVNYIDGSDSATFQTLADPDFYAARVFPYPQDEQTSGMQEFGAATAAAKIDPSVPIVQDGYFAAYVLVAGLKACGANCTRQELFNTMNNLAIQTNGLTPEPYGFTATVHQGVKNVGIYQLKNSSGGTGLPQLVATVPVGS
jgi:branched-chain amino acid transport system substrate-binding protein